MGCGKKAPPTQPKAYVIPKIDDLKYTLDENILSLDFSICKILNEDSNKVTGCYIYRSKQKISKQDNCNNCPYQFKKITNISFIKNDCNGDSLSHYIFQDEIEKNNKYVYKVNLYTNSNTMGPDSNYVELYY